MHPSLFDALTRSLPAARSRRAILILGLALPSWSGLIPGREEATARQRKRCRKPCGPCRRCRRGRCQSRPDGIACGDGKACVAGVCRLIPPTCSDGIQNSDETDVDCGGSCGSTCINGRACAGDGDCQSGHCVSLVCRECAAPAHCGAGRDCVGGSCCIVNGFDAEHACSDNGQCCSGNCATHTFGTTCRPAGCLPTGADCSAGPSSCCSFTCGGNPVLKCT